MNLSLLFLLYWFPSACFCFKDHSFFTLEDERILITHGPAHYLPIFDILATQSSKGDIQITFPLQTPTANGLDEMLTYQDLNLTDPNGGIFPQAISMVDLFPLLL
jgi:hypothetical protein